MNFATLDLNLLRVLDTILQEGSTTKAGERLGISQSAVSNALNRLRHSLEDDLFVRQGNQLVPTEYAASISDGLRDELERLEALLVRTDFDPADIRATFRIAAADYFSEMLIPQLSATLSQAAPGLLLQQVHWEPNEHLRALEQGTADLGLGPLLLPIDELPPWIKSMHLFSSGFVGIGAQDHPLLADVPDKAAISIESYFAASHVLFSVSGEVESFEDELLRELDHERRVALTVPSFIGIFRAVSESRHFALVPVSLAEKLAPQYGLKIFETPFELGKIQVHATWHKRSDKSPVARWIRQHIFDLTVPLEDG